MVHVPLEPMTTIQLDRRPTAFRGSGIHDFTIPLQTILIHDFTHPLQQYVAFRDFGNFNTKRPGSLSSELLKSRFSNSLSSRTPGIRSTEVSNLKIPVLLLLSEVNELKASPDPTAQILLGFYESRVQTLTSHFLSN
jgi:hypothetical protein